MIERPNEYSLDTLAKRIAELAVMLEHVEPATEPIDDDYLAEIESGNPGGLVRSLIARIRQAEDRLALSRASRDNCHERGLAMRAERDEARAEAARLREQVEQAQAADAGAFW